MRTAYLKPSYELDLLSRYDCVVGIDEVGRGAWAGPVAVGAFVFTKDCKLIEGIQDSKLLSVRARELRSAELSLFNHTVDFGAVDTIDAYGIGKTIESLIDSIIKSIKEQYASPFIIIDGQFSKDFGNDTVKENKSDTKYYSVAAASVLAKVQRDNYMRDLSDKFPEYGFNTNVGYPSKYHRDALKTYGPTAIHRKSYKPIKELLKDI
jgi:ribonuclease HII